MKRPVTVSRMIGLWYDGYGRVGGVIRGGWYVFCRRCWWVSEILTQPDAMDAAARHCRRGA